MQNIIVFIEPSELTNHPNQKIADLFLNRLTIEEEAAFESLGVYYLEQFNDKMWDRTQKNPWNKSSKSGFKFNIKCISDAPYVNHLQVSNCNNKYFEF